MDVATYFLILVAALIFYYLLGIQNSKKLNFPPGPIGIPYFGNVFSMKAALHETLNEWVELYGKVFTVKLFGHKMVVISDAQLGREAFNNPALTGRPPMKIFEAFSNGRHGVISTDGQEWVDQRRFALRHLRDFGFGKNTMEELIVDEVNEFMDWLKSGEGTPIMLDRRFNLAVVNSLWKIMTGTRLKQDDERLYKLLVTVQEGLTKVSSTPLGIFFPQLLEVFPNISGWGNLTGGISRLVEFIRESINEHKATYSPDFQRDFVDSYLKEMKGTKDPSSSFYGEYGNTSLESIMLDLFNAGSETTSATLTWAILYLTTFPEILKKLQKEIDRVVGRSRLPCLSDRENLPYAEAIVYETLRKSSLVALGVFHYSTQNTKLDKYDIPKDCWVSLNQYHIHNDPQVWGDPENFRPERFLNPDGKSVKKSDALVPFSVGRRMCLGESLARDEIFLFLTSIVQKFNIGLDPNSEKPGLESPKKQFLQPPQFRVIFKDRNSI